MAYLYIRIQKRIICFPPRLPNNQIIIGKSMFRTSKCTHGEKGMCINCMVNKNKQEKQNPTPVAVVSELKCTHPPHMKCIRCLTADKKADFCTHPDYGICKKCEHLLKFDKFQYILEKLQNDCSHKKPCYKCVPALSRKTYFIDKTCKKHLPYPQALCDSCMAPTITISPQKYTHVSRVIIRTTTVYRIIEANMFGILLGRIVDDVVYVENVYFPEEQEKGSAYINPESIKNYNYILEQFNLQEVGLLYSSEQITGLSLMISSMFQEKYLTFEQNHQISKFITMRLQMNLKEESQPHFECFMVSDQFQAFHKNNIFYEKQTHDNYFDLITARNDKLSQLPTFLRGGIETDKLYFKEVIVWIPTVSQQDFLVTGYEVAYPFFSTEHQSLTDMHKYISLQGDPITKYKNIQFLLHLQRLIGKQQLQNFLTNFFYDEPDLYLTQKLEALQERELSFLREFQTLPSTIKP